MRVTIKITGGMFLWARIRKRSLQVKKTGCLLQADGITKELNGNPVDLLKEYYSDFEIHKDDEQLAFTGGLVGGLGYDFVRYKEELPDNNPDTRRCDYSESLSDELLLLYMCVTYCLIFRILHLFGAKE